MGAREDAHARSRAASGARAKRQHAPTHAKTAHRHGSLIAETGAASAPMLSAAPGRAPHSFCLDVIASPRRFHVLLIVARK